MRSRQWSNGFYLRIGIFRCHLGISSIDWRVFFLHRRKYMRQEKNRKNIVSARGSQSAPMYSSTPFTSMTSMVMLNTKALKKKMSAPRITASQGFVISTLLYAPKNGLITEIKDSIMISSFLVLV